MKEVTEGYYIEHNGDCWQSIFPSHESHKSQLHENLFDALMYMRVTHNVEPIIVTPEVLQILNEKVTK